MRDPLSMGIGDRGGDLLDDHRMLTVHGSLHLGRRQAAAPSGTADQIGAPGLAPIIVDRCDVGMLESCDRLGRVLELPDEVGVGREFGR